jgi:hypothetical protein
MFCYVLLVLYVAESGTSSVCARGKSKDILFLESRNEAVVADLRLNCSLLEPV